MDEEINLYNVTSFFVSLHCTVQMGFRCKFKFVEFGVRVQDLLRSSFNLMYLDLKVSLGLVYSRIVSSSFFNVISLSLCLVLGHCKIQLRRKKEKMHLNKTKNTMNGDVQKMEDWIGKGNVKRIGLNKTKHNTNKQNQ